MNWKTELQIFDGRTATEGYYCQQMILLQGRMFWSAVDADFNLMDNNEPILKGLDGRLLNLAFWRLLLNALQKQKVSVLMTQKKTLPTSWQNWRHLPIYIKQSLRPIFSTNFNNGKMKNYLFQNVKSLHLRKGLKTPMQPLVNYSKDVLHSKCLQQHRVKIWYHLFHFPFVNYS